MREIGKHIVVDLDSCHGVFECANALQRALQSRAILLLVDDVWSATALEPFLAAAPRSSLLFTTRDRTIASRLGAKAVIAHLLEERESVLFLAKWAGISSDVLPDEVVDLIRECGRLPLALAVTGAMLRGKPIEIWRQVLERLRHASLEKMTTDLPGYQYPNLFKAIQVSVDALDPETRRCYLALGILLQDMPIVPVIQQILWNQSKDAALETSERLVSLSLAERRGGGIELHDLHFDFVRTMCPWRDSLPWIHEAIRLSSPVIQQDPSQFSSQLVGRLSGLNKNSELRSFNEYLRQATSFPWLRPLHGNLTSPGSCLRRIVPAEGFGSRRMAISADGRRGVSGGYGSLTVWDLEAGRAEREIRAPGRSSFSGFSTDSDCHYAATTLDNLGISVWDLDNGEKVCEFATNSDISRLAMSDDGRRVVSASADGVLTLWDIETRSQLWQRTVLSSRVSGLSISRDAHRAAIAFSEKLLVVWDLASDGELLRVSVPARFGFRLCLSGAGIHVCAAFDNTMIVWDVDSGHSCYRLKDQDGFDDVVLDAEGRRCISSSAAYPFLKVWDLTGHNPVLVLRGHTLLVESVAMCADGHRAISSSGDNTLRIWDLDSRRTSTDDRQHDGPVGAVASSVDGTRGLSSSHDGTVKVWDVATGKELLKLVGHRQWVRGLAVTNSNQIVSASERRLNVWDLRTGRKLRSHRRKVSPYRSNDVFGLAVTPDGRLAICAQSWETAEVRSIETGKTIQRLAVAQQHDGSRSVITGVAITVDGTRVVSVSEEGAAWVWGLISGSLLRTMEPRLGGLLAVATVGNSRAILASTELVIVDLRTGETLRRLVGHQMPVWGVAVSQDGKLAASASFDRTLKVWDLNSGSLVATFTNDGTLMSCAFLTPTRVIAGDAGGRVHFLELAGVSRSPIDTR